MNVIMHHSEDLELVQFTEGGLNIDTHDPEAHFSAMQMFATSMGLCTYSVLAGYAEQSDTPVDRLSIRLRWGYAEHPYRIDRIDMDIQWPELPPAKLEAAQRAATKCTLHNTLAQPPEVYTRLERESDNKKAI
jgi:uncharacterized OsmC-like protein